MGRQQTKQPESLGNILLNFFKKLFGWLKKKDAEEVEKPFIIGTRGRQIVVLVVIVILSCYVGGFLLWYTVIDGSTWRALANQQHYSEMVIPASRGSIYDASGTVLAQSSTVWNIIISPGDIQKYNEERYKEHQKKVAIYEADKTGTVEDPGEYVELKELVCKGLSEILGVDKKKLLEACENYERKYYIVMKNVEKPLQTEVTQYLKEHRINSDCAYAEQSSKRYYPNESLASNIIGFIDHKNEGIYGLEAYYDDYLSGTDGKVFYNNTGKGTGTNNDSDLYYGAVDGYSLVLTLDEVLQHYLEKNLELCVSQHEVVNRACGIIMNCNTGAVYAMATSPSYDLNYPSTLMNSFDKAKLEEMTASGATEEELIEAEAIMRETQWKNKAITELYYPGSVFKTVTCAAALEEEVVNENSTFYCGQVHEVAGTKIHCWSDYAHGELTLQQAITKSCNPSFIQIGQALGIQKFSNYFEAFGFTQPTGIDLPGEAQSLYVSRDRMGPVELASSAFGQTNKVTPIQMCTALCAIVNGGYLVTPYVVDKVLDSDGNVIETHQTEIKRQVISEETSATMRKILENVVESNGGSNAYISGYRIGGKSGTTEKIDEYNAAGGKLMGAKMDFVSSFAAFAPADAPEVVMLVMADTPSGANYYGSAVAAPVVSAVFKDGLEHLGIYPTYTAEEQAKMDATVPYVIGSQSMKAESSLSAQGFEVRFVGDPNSTESVTTQIPSSGTSIPKGSTVVLYLGDVSEIEVGVVPNVMGMSVEQANAAITNAGFNIKISGGAAENANAVAAMQSVAEGVEMYKGNVVEVTFQVNGYSD